MVFFFLFAFYLLQFFFGLDSFVEISSFEKVQVYSWVIYCHVCELFDETIEFSCVRLDI